MLILPLHTDRLHSGDDLVSRLISLGKIENGDVIVVSSKVLATIEGSATKLSSLEPTREAHRFAAEAGQTPEFAACVLQETKRMHGDVIGTCPYAMLTSLRPAGMKSGRILCPNAGLDLSNIEDGFAVGWPRDPVASAQKIKISIEQALGKNAEVGVIVSDSCCVPGRLGVTAFALATAGVDPINSNIGTPDLFGSPLRVTQEAQADQLAIAANAVMGNANQSCPAALIRDAGIHLSEYAGWVSGIEAEEDLFQGMFAAI